MVKKCSICHEVKDISEFYKSGSGTRRSCKLCVSNCGKKRRKHTIALLEKHGYTEVKEKKCTVCRELKDIICFNKSRTSVDGFTNICKECNKGYHKKKLERVQSGECYVPVLSKKCYKCGETRGIEEFHKNKYNYDGLQTLCKKCRETDNANSDKESKRKYDVDRYKRERKERSVWRKKYYNDNKEKHAINSKRYYKSNRAAISITGKEYRLSNAKYENFANRLTVDEAPRLSTDGVSLEVLCKYCNRYSIPSNGDVSRRVKSLNSTAEFDSYLYCSENCKQSCPTFGMHKYPRGFKKATSREVDPLLRQMCFARDNWECQICHRTTDTTQLHCHHIESYARNKIIANDLNNVITLCVDCHIGVHKLPGCKYYQLKC